MPRCNSVSRSASPGFRRKAGSDRQAFAWLEREKGIPKNLPVRDWKPRSDSRFGLFSAAAVGAGLLGYDDLAARLRQAGTETASLTQGGLLAVWRP